ncbi:mast cell protease 1A-like [Alosa alosa]|uniref:mast cell protease 1A-like n=1 Tax=Alosa alosa TaxID=278164 RepID=UPI0020153F69|nr:mast cell protease 1A-like [Alosa alosa]
MLLLLLLSHLSFSGAVQSGIFGGRMAKPHSRPYMASLQNGGQHVCGGVLISKDFVLTAAHCLNYRPLTVVLGAHNISKKEYTHQQHIGICVYIPHPNYPEEKLPNTDPRTREHDIMLLKLKTNAQLNEAVKVLELPRNTEKIPQGAMCEVAGWGVRVPGQGAESVLYESTVTLDDVKKCKRAWKKYFNPFQMTCSKSDGKDGVCQGDSGGPLICAKGKSKVLYGVTAYTGAPCDTPEYPEVYTRVPHFLPWIENVLDVNDAQD